MSDTPRYQNRRTLGFFGPERLIERHFRMVQATFSNPCDTEYVVLCVDCGSVVWNKEVHAEFHAKVDSK